MKKLFQLLIFIQLTVFALHTKAETEFCFAIANVTDMHVDCEDNLDVYLNSEKNKTHGSNSIYKKDISVKSELYANFSISKDEGCSPLEVTITNNSSGTECYWYWDKDDRIINSAVLAAADSTTNFDSFTKSFVNNSGATQVDSLTLIVGDGNGSYDIFKRAITILDMSIEFVDKSNVRCFGESNGSVGVTVSGSTAPYTYSWSNGLNTATIQSLYSGVYKVTVTDNQMCSKIDSIEIQQPDALVPAVDTIKDVTCFGSRDGYIILNPTGGNGQYSYLWSTGETTDSIGGLSGWSSGGLYSVTVTDWKGCSQDTSLKIIEPGQINISIDGTNVKCKGESNGSATVITPATSYMWSTGDTTATISGLSAGYYFVTITPVGSCPTRGAVEINEPYLPLSSTNESSDISCAGDANGTIDIKTTGGWDGSPYTYFWSTPDGSGLVPTNGGQTGLSEGKYYVTVTDWGNCTTTDSAKITEPPQIESTTLVSDVTCYGYDNGSIEITANGGTGQLQYSIDSGVTFQLSNIFNDLSSGTYNIVIIDENNCMYKDSITINGPEELIPEICMVSIDSSNHNMIIWNQLDNPICDSIYIYKETSQSEVYEKIGSKSALDASVFSDEESNPEQNSSKYKISVFDTCRYETELSNYHKTMHLTISLGTNGGRNLIWNPYEGFEYYTFNIYRGNSKQDLVKIDEQASNTYTFTDLNHSGNKNYYQIEIINPTPCNVNNSKSSKSNYESTKSNIVNSEETTSILTFLTESINIYPNPANNKLYIKSGLINQNIGVSILTLDGKIIISKQEIDINSGINISELNEGIYILRLNMGDNLVYKKFIKQ